MQARSRARVDAILDAADAVFLEMGYAEATTNHVAARAGTSIGSLYRFFPNKEALLVALAERYGRTMRQIAVELAEDASGDIGPDDLEARVARGIDTFNEFLVQHPGFRTLIEQGRNPALRQGQEAHQREMVSIIGAQQALPGNPLSPEERQVVALVTETVLGALQILSVSGDEALRGAVVAEAKLLVTGYLRGRLLQGAG